MARQARQPWSRVWECGEPSRPQLHVYEYILELNGIPSRFSRVEGNADRTELLVRQQDLLLATALILRERQQSRSEPVLNSYRLSVWLNEARLYLERKGIAVDELNKTVSQSQLKAGRRLSSY